MSKEMSEEELNKIIRNKDFDKLVKGESLNTLGIILSQKGNLLTLTDLNGNQIIGLVGAYSYLTFIPSEDERLECEKLLDILLLALISKKRHGRKELLKLTRSMRQFLSLFQRKSTQSGVYNPSGEE